MSQRQMQIDRYKKIASGFGVKLNEDPKHVNGILDGLDKKAEKFGERYCPCKVQNVKENICPCKEFTSTLHCHCGLFVKPEEGK